MSKSSSTKHKYLTAVKLGSKTELFMFKTMTDRAKFIKEIKKKIPTAKIR